MTRINWPQAFAEVSLIVIGVGVALAADSWNERRVEHQEEQEYLRSLLADFEQSHDNLEASIDYNSSVRDTNLELLSLLERPRASVPKDTLVFYTNRAFRLMPFGVVLGTYGDMVNSGKLKLIRSDSLRLALAEFEAKHAELLSWVDQAIGQWNDLQVPFLIERANVIEHHGGRYRGITYPRGPVGPRTDAYWSDEFANIVAISIISKQDVLLYADGLLHRVDDILHLIDENLVVR